MIFINYPATTSLVKRKEEDEVLWRKTLHIKSRILIFFSFFLVLYINIYCINIYCIVVVSFVIVVGFLEAYVDFL